MATNLRIRVEGDEFVISRSGASLSVTLKKMLDDGASDVITLPNIGSLNMSMIISYLETHAAVDLSDEQKRNFDSEFASNEDSGFLKKLMIDAHNLKIEGLKGVLAPKVAANTFNLFSEMWANKDADKIQALKESRVRTILKMDWAFLGVKILEEHRKRVLIMEDRAFLDAEKHRKRVLMEGLQEKIKKLRI